ncbi:MAG: cell division protein FtsX [Armatimonadetes bacterium]|jgi:cell division transport system permease protein|nr:cell division protein FtsX [Armatimonadota bacterium]
MAFACVSTTTISLTILGGFLLVAWQVHSIAQAVPRRFEVHAFLRAEVPREEAEALVAQVKEMPGVAKVRLVPKEVAWTEYRKHYPHQEDLEGMTENPLPDKLEIIAATPEQTLEVAEAVRVLPAVAQVNEGKELLQKLLAIAGIVRLAGIILAALLALGTAAIVGNAIRMTLYARRRDIRVMQLVGATDSFIRLPFVLEGAVVGAVGGGLAAALMAAALHYLTSRVLTDLPLVSEIRVTLDPASFCGALVMGGALLGTLGSLASLRRFLRGA